MLVNLYDWNVEELSSEKFRNTNRALNIIIYINIKYFNK